SRNALRGGRARGTSSGARGGVDGAVRGIRLAMKVDDSPYQGYLYAYPHKTAYRRLEPRRDLREVWRDEPRDALFGYVHVPFCEMRCGFCNLFTRANPAAEQVTAYLAQLRRQAAAVRESIGEDATFAQLAIGGGTPT